MIRNYLKVAFRNILKHKGYSLINIFGLAAGMTCVLLISVWVLDELGYDRFHKAAPEICRVEEDQTYTGRIFHVTVTPYPLGPALVAEVPEIVDAARVAWTGSHLFRVGEKAFYENQLRAVDPSFLRLFDFRRRSGDVSALDAPGSIVLTRDLAVKYFGAEDPMGRVISLDDRYDFKVTAVLENLPSNSTLRFDALLPYKFVDTLGISSTSFGNNSIFTFVRLRPGATAAAVSGKIKGFVKAKTQDASSTDLTLMPLTRLHLYEYFGFERGLGAVGYVYIFSVIALFVLLIACINFMNLATARSARRSREVGLRKTSGATRAFLIRQFLGESALFAAIALVIAVGAATLLLPPFGRLAGKVLSWRVAGFGTLLAGLAAVTLGTGLVAGSYPALYLSSFEPANVLKGRSPSARGPARFRRVLVVVQFALSVLLLIGTSVVSNQLRYMQARKLGWNKTNLIYLPLRGEAVNSYAALKAELRREPRVAGVTGCQQLPSSIGSNGGGADWDGRNPANQPLIGFDFVDYDYVETLGIELAEGRSFSKTFPGDETTGFLVNEEVAKLMEKKAAAGERFRFQDAQDGRIVGVMKNFHYQPARSPIEPLAIRLSPASVRNAIVRLAPGDVQAAVAAVEKAWKRVLPRFPFDARFFDEEMDRMYRSEKRISALLAWFSGLAVVIACLGLFGLASFTAEQRTREIGIRKVLGATVPGIVSMMCRESLRLVLIANVLAWPAAWWIMSRWLRTFAYRSSLGLGIFLAALGIAVGVALLSVVSQALRAGNARPAVSIRYE